MTEARTDDILTLAPGASLPAEVPATRYGARAWALWRMMAAELPVPPARLLPVELVRAIAEGAPLDAAALLAGFGDSPLVAVRASPVERSWGGPAAVPDVGMNERVRRLLAKRIGEEAAARLHARFIVTYALRVARLDDSLFAGLPLASAPQAALAEARRIFEEETGAPPPEDPAEQLEQVIRSLARAWEGTSARLLRQAQGAPADAGLGLIVQEMLPALGPGVSGRGRVQFVDPESGAPGVFGRFVTSAAESDLTQPPDSGIFLARDPRGPSLEDLAPESLVMLREAGERARRHFREAMAHDFVLENGRLWLLDAAPAERSPRAAIRIVVDLAEEGLISREEALLRIDTGLVPALLHARVDPAAPRAVLARGIPASPGAAAGRLVFTSQAAQALAARGENAILVRPETGPEDVRGMHVASGVLTARGGLTSHAAVIARGLGLPCVVGAGEIEIDLRGKTLEVGGERLGEGAPVTLDAATGELLAGELPLLEPALDRHFETLFAWADEVRRIAVRANADTPADARLAQGFGAEGIGLCRTEHMFFEGDRLTVMREMIFARTEADRRAALERLLPMQRSDFLELFRIMNGQPVTIRLFDPPLHEFLPHERSEMQTLAEALDIPVSEVMARTEALSEFNPMLGLRGVRLGIIMPEIYETQARAIFEAVLDADAEGVAVTPEIMLPLVSAAREVDLLRSRIAAVARQVEIERGARLDYHLGVVVETPRAALRAGEIAEGCSFLSFGTNDLTQMTYGLSRDDAGRFMSGYVQHGVFPEDPFHTLDVEGVGELVLMAAERARQAKPGIVLAMCGEHGGDPASIAFCCRAGFDYVSCSPFRVPLARLAAAQCAIRGRTGGGKERQSG